jgi:hypothetical protein
VLARIGDPQLRYAGFSSLVHGTSGEDNGVVVSQMNWIAKTVI